MIFQRMIDRLTGQTRRSKQADQARASRRGRRGQRRLRMESLQKRELMASDLAAISGIAYIDSDGSGTMDGGEPAIEGALITLYRDANGNGTLETGTDVSVGTVTTAADGAYRFTNLDGSDAGGTTATGVYFLTQEDAPGGPDLSALVFPDTATVTITDDTGVTEATIDAFSIDQPSQPITETVAGGTTTSSSGALTSGGDVIGDERDVEIFLDARTSGDSQFSIVTGSSELVFSNGGDVTATLLVQYDGVDADGGGLALNATGLGGADLSGSDSAAGIVLSVRSDQAVTDAIEVRIYTDAANYSTTMLNLPSNIAGPAQELFVPFSAFSDVGTGADFGNVGAIEVFVDGVGSNGGAGASSLDLFVSVLESQSSNENVVNLASIQPMELGGEIFVDNGGGTNQTNQNNGIRDAGEPDFPNPGAGNEVVVELYELTGPGDTVEATDTPVATTTAAGGGTSGAYTFTTLTSGDPLPPGTYAVVIPESEFATGQPLFGHSGSGTAAADTDANANNDNDGTWVDGIGLVSGAITLEVNGEPTTDGTDNNTNSTVDFGVVPNTDLRITKSLVTAQSNLIAGGTAVFDLVIQNLGPLDATDVSVDDFIPDGLTFDRIEDSGGGAVATTTTTEVGGAGREIRTFSIGALAASGSVTYRVFTDIDSNVAADPENEARVSGFEVEVDNDPSNPVDSDPLLNNVSLANADVPIATLSVTKTDNLATVTAGNQLTYEITITNTSTDNAINVTALDTLPTGVTFVSASFTDGTGSVSEVTAGPDAGKIQMVLGDLAAGEDETIAIVVTVDPAIADGASPLDNSVTATADNAPDVTTNDTTAVVREVDMTLTKTVIETRTPDDRTDGDDSDDIIDDTAPFQVIAGGFATYQIVVTNDGPSEARGVEVEDILDSGLTLVAGSFDAGTSGVTLSEAGQTLTFTVPDMDPGESLTFEFEVAIGSDEFDVIPNTAVVSTTDPESDTNNNSATVNIDPDARIDLILDKSAAETTVVPGADTVTYTFTVSHDDDSVSDAVTPRITDTLPAGLSNVQITAAGSSSSNFNTTTRLLEVEYASIPVGETRTFTVTANVDPTVTADLVNSAAVAVPGVTELDNTNNTDSVTIGVTPEFDLTVAKTVQGGATTFGPDDTVTFNIVVSHDTDDDGTEADNGESPSTATGVIVTDTLPDGLTFASATSGGSAVTPTSTTNGVIVFPEFDLAPGTTRTLTITATVDDDASGSITNNVSLATDTGETQTDNNSDAEAITVVPEANVRVTKTVDATTAQTGTELTYTVTVFNDGPSPAEAVTAVDTLPAGLTFVSGTGPSGALSATGQTVTVNGGTVASGSSFQFTIVASINDGVTADQINNVTVSTTTTETNSNDNTASATTAIDQAINEISGNVYRDANNNGVRDAGEIGYEGVQLQLTGTLSDGSTFTPVTVTTDANGEYLFEDLLPGKYTVTRLSLPSGTSDGPEFPSSAEGALGNGESIEDIDVGGTNPTTVPLTDFTVVDNSKRSFLASFMQTPGIQNRPNDR
ncbi:DUF11 domain-containing protein [Rhodopirellula sp. JC740]|uniref:DUF11 domain-containing protein n=1 Tax=Rhodopirellula halodulae TaxID=2894198 RepID=A0ABS8NJV8_9BACT|nr:SdrD B-like domain-containing protein [Rhodopirellula sp. JC740]MCC9643806.1 DUF11 domain-containing protein [Rhodopirellula sp. JC740]